MGAFLLFTLLLPVPQEKPVPPQSVEAQSVEALAQRVEAAHRSRADVPPVTAFTGNLELHVLDAAAAERGQVDLAVKFMEWKPPQLNRTRPLIRYEVGDAGTVVVRGIDRAGPWMLHQGQPRDLDSADFVRDLEECQRHTNLARQLVRFLSPGDVLRALQQPTAVREETLQLDRTAPRVPCLTVAGNLPAFPLLQRGGEDAPVRLTVHVTAAEGRLLAVDACPLVDGKPDDARTERIVLGDLRERGGLLVPYELLHLFRQENGQLRLKSRAVIVELSLRPEVRAEDFDRARKR